MGLANNGPFWADYIANVFLPYVRLFRETVFNRLLPSFDTIADEADEHAKAVASEIGRHAGPDTDYGDIAEAGLDAGIIRYDMLSGLRQTLVNMCAVALRHLLDQQQIVLLKRELLPRRERDNRDLQTEGEFVSRLQEQGIDPTEFASWEELEVLRHAANAVKHGEGRSSDKLRELRPGLLIYPPFRADEIHEKMSVYSAIEQPLMGDNLYVTDEELRAFFDAVEAFWEHLIAAFYSVTGFSQE